MQARSHRHLYVVRCGEPGLVTVPTLLPPLVPRWAAIALRGIWDLSTRQAPGPSPPIPATSLLNAVMMGTFCQTRYGCCLWFSSIKQLGDLDASLPALCICFPCMWSRELHILSVNWKSCSSTVRIETKSCELQLVKYLWGLLASGTHLSVACCFWYGNTANDEINRWESRAWFPTPRLLTYQPNKYNGKCCEGSKQTDSWWNVVHNRASKSQQEDNTLKVGLTLPSAINNWALLPPDKPESMKQEWCASPRLGRCPTSVALPWPCSLLSLVLSLTRYCRMCSLVPCFCTPNLWVMCEHTDAVGLILCSCLLILCNWLHWCSRDDVWGYESQEDVIKVEGAWSSGGREVIFRRESGEEVELNMMWKLILQYVLVADELI